MAKRLLTPETYRYLGGSGVKVSNICLGAMTFGQTGLPGNCDEAASHKILDRFVELGGNFIDTANIYGRGASETIVGNWLSRQERHKIVLASKVRMQMEDDNPNSGGLSRKSIMWSVEESLKRLKTDYIDLFQIHCWDWGTPLEETLRTLDDLVRAGKVRYIGGSNVSSWQFQKIIDYNKFHGLNKWITLQTQYSLLVRDPETEFTDVCKIEGLGLLPWSPLKGGWLSGKIKKGDKAAPEGSRVAWSEAMGDKVRYQSCPKFTPYANEGSIWDLLDKMTEIGKANGKSVAQVALRWLLQKEAVSSVIIGCKTVEQLEDNMGAGAGWELSTEQMSTLDNASAVEPLQVAAMIDRLNATRHRKDWTQ
ncbi:1-deoxyxylulose-5-phosphate synthase YajO-like [Apostichopus japonicus]|uniref:1-deoxyxylulose-5-phosphate synthase YajO-like n=1 Tax=Stichopus japonicus TaxID=307972 RepID=UPI003AB5504D